MPNPKKTKREEKEINYPPIIDNDDDDDDADAGDDDLNDSESEENSDESSSDGEDADMVNTVITVGFDAFPPDDSDFHGIKKLLLQLFRNAHINVSDLANHVIELNKLSCVLRQSDEDLEDDEEEDDAMEDDDDVFGIGSLLPLDSDREGVRGLKTFLLKQAEEESSVHSKLEKIFTKGRMGLLLLERFVNIPPSIAVPVLKSIQDDWNKMPKSNKLFDFTHLVIICKQYLGKNSVLYANGEEELFADIADFKFSYEVPAEDADTAIADKWKESDEELKQFRQVLILDAKKFPRMIELVEQNV